MKWGCGSIGLALSVAVIVGWMVAAKTPTHAYRLTIEVATPEGPRSASVVRHVFAPCTGLLHKLLPIGAGAGSRVDGEAAFVDLGGGRNVIALMAGGPQGDNVDQPLGLAYYAMQDAGLINTDRRAMTPPLRLCDFTLKAGTAVLSPRLLPTIVTFSDLNDPASARVLQPTEAGFTSVLGPGYRLARLAVEMVPVGIWPLDIVGLWGEPVTRGIERRVPFLVSQREPLRRVSRDMPPRFQTEFSQFLRE